jgi:hypothetical protein
MNTPKACLPYEMLKIYKSRLFGNVVVVVVVFLVSYLLQLVINLKQIAMLTYGMSR